jgi:hypothetical protein
MVWMIRACACERSMRVHRCIERVSLTPPSRLERTYAPLRVHSCALQHLRIEHQRIVIQLQTPRLLHLQVDSAPRLAVRARHFSRWYDHRRILEGGAALATVRFTHILRLHMLHLRVAG